MATFPLKQDMPLKKLEVDNRHGELVDTSLRQYVVPFLGLCPAHIFLRAFSWSDFHSIMDQFDFEAKITRVEKLTWIVSPEYFSRQQVPRLTWNFFENLRHTWNFFENLKVLDLYGRNDSICELLCHAKASELIEEVRIEVYGAINEFAPLTFYDDLPQLLSHLFPLARINLVPGACYGEIGSEAGKRANYYYGGHLILDRLCPCLHFSGEPL